MDTEVASRDRTEVKKAKEDPVYQSIMRGLEDLKAGRFTVWHPTTNEDELVSSFKRSLDDVRAGRVKIQYPKKASSSLHKNQAKVISHK